MSQSITSTIKHIMFKPESIVNALILMASISCWISSKKMLIVPEASVQTPARIEVSIPEINLAVLLSSSK